MILKLETGDCHEETLIKGLYNYQICCEFNVLYMIIQDISLMCEVDAHSLE